MKPSALVFIALLNSILGLSILFPILGPLGRELRLSELETGCLSTAYSLMQFLCSAGWGRKSERVGRKPVLLRGILGYAVTFLGFGVIAHLGRAGVLQGSLLFGMLVGARILGGLYSSATLPVAQAYVADITARERRTAGMALIGAAFGLGIVLGPAVAVLLAPFGLMVPIYASSAIAFLNGIFVAVWLPEPERKADAGETLALAHVARSLRGILLVGFTITITSVAVEQTLAFYFQDKLALGAGGTVRFVGKALVVAGVAAVLVQGFIVRRVRWPPLQVLKTGVPLALASVCVLVAGHSEAWFIAGMVLYGLGQGFMSPGFTAVLSLRANDANQGSAAGLSSSSQALARTLGPLVGTGLYEFGPEYPFLFSALLLIAVLAVLYIGQRLGANGWASSSVAFERPRPSENG